MFQVIAGLSLPVLAAGAALFGASFTEPMHGAHTDALTTTQNFINRGSIYSSDHRDNAHVDLHRAVAA